MGRVPAVSDSAHPRDRPTRKFVPHHGGELPSPCGAQSFDRFEDNRRGLRVAFHGGFRPNCSRSTPITSDILIRLTPAPRLAVCSTRASTRFTFASYWPIPAFRCRCTPAAPSSATSTSPMADPILRSADPTGRRNSIQNRPPPFPYTVQRSRTRRPCGVLP